MFRNKWNFMQVFGIQIGIDLSWMFIALLLTWTLAVGHFPLAYPGYSIGAYWLMGLIGMLGLFVCVVLHELGHALTAKHYSLPISQITLFLFGGVAEIKKEPQSPKVEFLVAAAGPLVTLILAGILLAFSYVGTILAWPFFVVGLTSYLGTINLFILLFNLVPAFPLDGGRMLRALLWKWKGNLEWATAITTKMGKGFGIFLILFGILNFIGGSILGGVWLAIIGLFLQKAASSSNIQLYVTKELEKAQVASFMVQEVETAEASLTLRELLDLHVYRSHHHLYPVTEEGRLVGYVSLEEIKKISQDLWKETKILEVMVPLASCPTICPSTSALEALSLMEQSPTPTLLVVDQGKLAGLLTSQDLFKVISLKLEIEDLRK